MAEKESAAGATAFLAGAGEVDLRLVIEALPIALVVVDERGLLVSINAAAEALFGYRRDELLGESIERLVPRRFAHAGFRRGFMIAPTARAMGAGRDLRGLRRDGSEIPVEIGLNPILTSEGTLVLAAIIDISERKAAEKLQILNAGVLQHSAQLEALTKELENFSYSVSHDLRAPVRAISGYARAIEEDYGAKLDDEGRRLLCVVQSESKRMGELIDDLLEFSRLGRRTMDEASIDMTALARDVVREQVAYTSADRVQIAVDRLPPAWGDRMLLRQIWANLISNAIKFSVRSGAARVRVSGALINGEAVYHVADNGVGFDMRYAGKLFGVFQRLHHGDQFEGSGVGLAIVHRVVTRHSGRVWAEGRPGEGATFSFSLPADRAG
jgi:PAS domain S-box-containing protein